MKKSYLKLMSSLFFVMAFLSFNNSLEAASAHLLSVDECCATYLLKFNDPGGDWVFYPDEDNPDDGYSGNNSGGTLEIVHCFDGPGTYQWYFDQNGNGNSSTTEIVDCVSDCCEAPKEFTIKPVGDSCEEVEVCILGLEDCDITSFVVQYRIEGDTWQTQSSTESCMTISGLVPGKTYEFRVLTGSLDCDCFTETSDVQVYENPECEPCCDLSIKNLGIRQVNPFNPCQVVLGFDIVYHDNLCGELETKYSYGDGEMGTNSFHSYPGPGPWELCVTLSYGDCEYEACEWITLKDCMGFTGGGSSERSNLVDQNFLGAVSMTPNPAVDHVGVKIFQDELNPINNIYILDTAGKILSKQAVFSENADVELDISNLPTGIYFVQMNNNNGIVATERLVKVE